MPRQGGAPGDSVQSHKFLGDAVVLSDDAGQFNVGRHALCWIHAERLVHKVDTFTDEQRTAQARVRGLIWNFYASLKAYQLKPAKRRFLALRARFDRIFLRRTGFVTLDRLLARLIANKDELRWCWIVLRSRCTPMARRTISDATSRGARSAPGHAATPAAIAAMQF